MTMLTSLAAAYVPIAFVTVSSILSFAVTADRSYKSFLGMHVTNARTPLIPKASGSSASNSQANGTQSNSSLPDSGGGDPEQRLWDLRWFGILSAPLLFVTIILPLVAGPCIRSSLQTYRKFRKFWRFSIVALIALYLIIYYTAGKYPLVKYILVYTLDTSACLIGMTRLWYRFSIKELKMRWQLFLIFAFGCFVVDALVTEPVFMGAFAWLALLIIYLYSYGYLWQSWQWCLSLFRHRDT